MTLVRATNSYSIQDSNLGPQAQKAEAAQKFEFWRSEKNWLVQPQQHVSTWQQHILACEVSRKNWMCFLHTFAAIKFNKEQYRTKLQLMYETFILLIASVISYWVEPTLGREMTEKMQLMSELI